MKQKIVIKVRMHCEKCRKKGMKIAASADGVISVTLQGSDKDEIAVVGNSVDSAGLCTALRKKLGHANLLTVEEVKDPKPEQKKDQKSEEKKPETEKKPEEKKPENEEKKQGDAKKEGEKDESKKSTQEVGPINHHFHPCQPNNCYCYSNRPPHCYLYTTIYDDDYGNSNSSCKIM